MKHSNHYIRLFAKILISFAFYVIALLFFKIQIPSPSFFIAAIILFISIILIIIYNNDSLDLLYKVSDRLYLDVTDKKKYHSNLDSVIATLHLIEKDIVNKHNDISELEKSRSKFLGNVSHELKTPLFVLQGYVETLLGGAINDKDVNIEFLEKIKTQTARLNNLLSDLVKISMIESDELKLSKEEVELDIIIDQIKNTFHDILIKRGNELIVPEKTNIKIFADKENMISVFNNLINNAINYSSDGDIIISIKKIKNHVNIKIIDHGIGMSEKHLNRIFERFYRVDSDRSRQTGGTGLGLAIVKHILLAHDIQIYVKSQKNIGSEFSFSIPILKT